MGSSYFTSRMWIKNPGGEDKLVKCTYWYTLRCQYTSQGSQKYWRLSFGCSMSSNIMITERFIYFLEYSRHWIHSNVYNFYKFLKPSFPQTSNIMYQSIIFWKYILTRANNTIFYLALHQCKLWSWIVCYPHWKPTRPRELVYGLSRLFRYLRGNLEWAISWLSRIERRLRGCYVRKVSVYEPMETVRIREKANTLK